MASGWYPIPFLKIGNNCIERRLSKKTFSPASWEIRIMAATTMMSQNFKWCSRQHFHSEDEEKQNRPQNKAINKNIPRIFCIFLHSKNRNPWCEKWSSLVILPFRKILFNSLVYSPPYFRYKYANSIILQKWSHGIDSFVFLFLCFIF